MEQFYRSIPIKFHEAFLNANEVQDDIQLLRVGTFFHECQQITVDKNHLKSMVKNFKENTRGIDLMLDYSHDSEKEAAAWFTDIYLSEDGKELWGKVDWTDDGANAVRSKKYRYISADFQFAYKDNETLKDYGPTLFGAGLTNRPVIKKMNATIELSENKTLSEDNKMNEEMKKKFADMEADLKKKDEKIKELTEKLSAGSKLSEDEATKQRIADLEKRENDIKLAEKKIEDDKKLSEKKGSFDKMLSEGKVVEAQREAFMSDDFAKFAENSNEVNLSEKGSGKAGSGEGDNAVDEFKDSETPAQDEVLSLAEKKMSENKELSEADAYGMVLSEKPELAKKYRIEVEG